MSRPGLKRIAKTVEFMRFKHGMKYQEIRSVFIRKGWVKDAPDFEALMQEIDALEGS